MFLRRVQKPENPRFSVFTYGEVETPYRQYPELSTEPGTMVMPDNNTKAVPPCCQLIYMTALI